MMKVLCSIVTALIISSLLAAASAYVQVQVLEVKVITQKDMIIEIRKDVKSIKKFLGVVND